MLQQFFKNILTLIYVLFILSFAIAQMRSGFKRMKKVETNVAMICKALGEPNRLRIVQILSDGEMCACKLLAAFNITQPTLSHHINILCECKLVNMRKEGKWSHYSLNCETLDAFKSFISALACRQDKRGKDCP